MTRLRRTSAALVFALLPALTACAPPSAVRTAAPAAALVLLPAPVGGGERFVGSDACRGCHPGPWGRWRATAHAAKAPPKSVEIYAIDCGQFPPRNADGFADDGSYKTVTRGMIDDYDMSRAKRAERVDAAAAAWILESALARLR